MRIRFKVSTVTAECFEYRVGEVHEVSERFAEQMIKAGAAEAADETAAAAGGQEKAVTRGRGAPRKEVT